MKLNELIDRISGPNLNGSDLAYVGDAYYELYIRTYLLSKGYTKPNQLHDLCTMYVNGNAHSLIVKEIFESLSEDEKDIYKRGRNYSYKHRPKGLKMSEYLMSSGFEALVGYLFLTNKEDRLEEILTKSILIIENKNNENK